MSNPVVSSEVREWSAVLVSAVHGRRAAATMAVLRERFSKNYSKPVRISVYLPMVGREVNTWPLVASLLSSDSPKFLVSVPK